MTRNKNSLWETLLASELVEGNSPKNLSPNSPWYVKGLLAISAWLAALFLLGFTVMFFTTLIEEPLAAFLVGASLLACAYWILTIPKNEFYEHLGLAISLAGQVLFLWSMMAIDNDPVVWLCFAFLHSVLALIMRSFIHRVFSTVCTILACEVSLIGFGIPYVLPSIIILPTVWLCLHEFSFVKKTGRLPFKKISGLMYGLVVAMLVLNSTHLFTLDLWRFIYSSHENIINFPYWIAVAIFIASVVISGKLFLFAYEVNNDSRLSVTVLVFTFLLAVITFKAPGIMAGVLVVLLGFAHSNRVLFGLGVIALLIYGSSYYYLMDETLLFKSGILLMISITMLFSRIMLIRLFPLVKER